MKGFHMKEKVFKEQISQVRRLGDGGGQAGIWWDLQWYVG